MPQPSRSLWFLNLDSNIYTISHYQCHKCDSEYSHIPKNGRTTNKSDLLYEILPCHSYDNTSIHTDLYLSSSQFTSYFTSNSYQLGIRPDADKNTIPTYITSKGSALMLIKTLYPHISPARDSPRLLIKTIYLHISPARDPL